eukprot:SAG31_NODE_1009_length_10404_cov_27.639981_6_plen_135_part_00
MLAGQQIDQLSHAASLLFGLMLVGAVRFVAVNGLILLFSLDGAQGKAILEQQLREQQTLLTVIQAKPESAARNKLLDQLQAVSDVLLPRDCAAVANFAHLNDQPYNPTVTVEIVNEHVAVLPTTCRKSPRQTWH